MIQKGEQITWTPNSLEAIPSSGLDQVLTALSDEFEQSGKRWVSTKYGDYCADYLMPANGVNLKDTRRQVTIKITEQDRDRLDANAKELGLTASEYFDLRLNTVGYRKHPQRGPMLKQKTIMVDGKTHFSIIAQCGKMGISMPAFVRGVLLGKNEL